MPNNGGSVLRQALCRINVVAASTRPTAGTLTARVSGLSLGLYARIIIKVAIRVNSTVNGFCLQFERAFLCKRLRSVGDAK